MGTAGLKLRATITSRDIRPSVAPWHAPSGPRASRRQPEHFSTRHQNASDPLPECDTRAVASFGEPSATLTWWNAATPARRSTMTEFRARPPPGAAFRNENGGKHHRLFGWKPQKRNNRT
jgi:hypothetical protein